MLIGQLEEISYILRGYISQCSGSAALNTLTIKQLACECSGGPGVGRGPVDRVAWPSPSISGVHAYNN